MTICKKNGPEKKIINRAMNGSNVEKQVVVQCGGSEQEEGRVMENVIRETAGPSSCWDFQAITGILAFTLSVMGSLLTFDNDTTWSQVHFTESLCCSKNGL